MEILLFVLSLLIGGAIGYGISNHFHKKASSERPEWFTLEGITELITRDPSKIEWTPKQLVQLYNDAVYSDDANDPLPYNFCPDCGSEDLHRGSYNDPVRDNQWYFIKCADCDWNTATE